MSHVSAVSHRGRDGGGGGTGAASRTGAAGDAPRRSRTTRRGRMVKYKTLQSVCRFTHRTVRDFSPDSRIPPEIRQPAQTVIDDGQNCDNPKVVLVLDRVDNFRRHVDRCSPSSATGTALWTGYTEGVRAPTRVHHDRSIHQAGASRLSIDSEHLHARRCRGREGPKDKKISSRDRQSAGHFPFSGARVAARETIGSASVRPSPTVFALKLARKPRSR